MERLTERTALGICGNNERVEHYPLYNIENDEHMAFGLINQCFEKLAEYEQAEEDGLLKRLPCKVGDAVYFTDRKYDRENRVFVPFVHNGYVKAIKFSARPTKVTIEYEDLDDSHGRCKGHDIHASNIGKTVFLTKAEAEHALAKMKGEEE